LEWYPWSTFSDIEEIGKGGFATVFRAKRKLSKIKKWDHQSNQWKRIEKGDYLYYEYVALKTMGDSESKNFLQEVQ